MRISLCSHDIGQLGDGLIKLLSKYGMGWHGDDLIRLLSKSGTDGARRSEAERLSDMLGTPKVEIGRSLARVKAIRGGGRLIQDRGQT